jgi:hypothetical protein
MNGETRTYPEIAQCGQKAFRTTQLSASKKSLAGGCLLFGSSDDTGTQV